MERQLLTVSGHVQGVGFRYNVQKLASRRGLTGFVRNLENGDVYIEVQGEHEAIREFQESLRGIPFATVLEIQTESTDPVPEESVFRVKY